MKTLPILFFFFMPLFAFACDASEPAAKSSAKLLPVLHAATAAPHSPAAPAPASTAPAKPPRHEPSTPRPRQLFM
jgi:hypothetical protein